MTGIEYELLHAMEPILYVIRKQHRQSPTQGLQCVIIEVMFTFASTESLLVALCDLCHWFTGTTLFHVRGRNLATELSLWPGQSYGTVCQQQFVMWTVYTLLNADSNRTFLACVLMIDSVMPFRSGFTHGGH